MVRGVYINRAPAERLTVDAAVQRYLAEVTISKRPTTQAREKNCVKPLQARLGKHSLAALTPDVVAAYRDCIALKGESLRKKHAETASTESIVTD